MKHTTQGLYDQQGAETMMRDPRWERVHAYMGQVQGYLYDEEEDVRNFVEILIEVPLKDTVWYSKQLIHKEDLAALGQEGFAWLMEEMVLAVDDYMSGKRTN